MLIESLRNMQNSINDVIKEIEVNQNTLAKLEQKSVKCSITNRNNLCDLPEGHEGDHMSDEITWRTTMTERRPHWDDNLIEAAFKACPQLAFEHEVYPVIAAVEDWQATSKPSGIKVWEFAPTGTMRLLKQQRAQIQAVRDVCEDKYVAPNSDYGQGFQNGYNDALAQVLRALDGERDE